VGDDVVAERLDLKARERLVDAFDFCRQTMSGEHSFSQASRGSSRCRIELTFQVAMRMRRKSDREACAATAGGGGVSDCARETKRRSKSSTKSTSDPDRNGTEAGSTSTTALSRSITRSSSAFARSTSNLY